MKRIRAALLSLLIISFVSVPLKARAEGTMREFVLSCSYGVLAGTLVGAATLAFSDKPGDNLNKIARGASLGLYAGIVLGLYVMYGGPSESDEEEPIVMLEPPRLIVAPVIDETGLKGASAQYTLVKF